MMTCKNFSSTVFVHTMFLKISPCVFGAHPSVTWKSITVGDGAEDKDAQQPRCDAISSDEINLLKRRGFLPSGVDTAFDPSASPSRMYSDKVAELVMKDHPHLSVDQAGPTIAATLKESDSSFVANVASAWWLGQVRWW